MKIWKPVVSGHLKSKPYYAPLIPIRKTAVEGKQAEHMGTVAGHDIRDAGIKKTPKTQVKLRARPTVDTGLDGDKLHTSYDEWSGIDWSLGMQDD
ncbi:hypothetical protein [Paenibacillus sp. MBLB4367]|uniref:hypothetical protein n=1 Tax=Paenibacillus sp. MBLB4367 TaxID=3384767 RepID=UPI00390816A5